MLAATNQTPFDRISTNLNAPLAASRTKHLLLAFVEVLRIRYLQMFRTSEKFWQIHDAMQAGHPPDARINELLQTDAIEARVNYFSFIEELNRFGRAFQEHQSIPDFSRIRFYRNKMVEHWDDYPEFLIAPAVSICYTHGKLVIPYHAGQGMALATAEPAYKELKVAFQKETVNLPVLTFRVADRENSEKLFESLEKIDLQLQLGDGRDHLINALFKFGFPTPIHDLEVYCGRLVQWFEAL